MKFYDKKRNLHDTCCGAVLANVKDTVCKIFHIKNDISDDDLDFDEDDLIGINNIDDDDDDEEVIL